MQDHLEDQGQTLLQAHLALSDFHFVKTHLLSWRIKRRG